MIKSKDTTNRIRLEIRNFLFLISIIVLACSLLDSTLLQTQNSQVFAQPIKNKNFLYGGVKASNKEDKENKTFIKSPHDPFGKNTANDYKLDLSAPCDPLCPQQISGSVDVSFQAEWLIEGQTAFTDIVLSAPVEGDVTTDGVISVFYSGPSANSVCTAAPLGNPTFTLGGNAFVSLSGSTSLEGNINVFDSEGSCSPSYPVGGFPLSSTSTGYASSGSASLDCGLGSITCQVEWNIVLNRVNGGGQNNPPIARAIVSPSNDVQIGTAVTLDGSGSSDPDSGDFVQKYKWEQIGTPLVTLSNAVTNKGDTNAGKATFIAPEVDDDTQLTFKLNVTDTHGASDIETVNVNIKLDVCRATNTLLSTSSPFNELTTSDGNCPPFVIAGNDQTVNERVDVSTRTTVQLNSTAIDPDGDPITYLWKPAIAGAPTLSNDKIRDPTFNVPDVHEDTFYTYTLTVNDGKEDSLPDSITIKVIATKVAVDLQHDEIKPKIAKLLFDNIIHFPGDTLPNSSIQPEVPGGIVKVRATLEGITNAAKIPIKFTFDPLIDTGGHDHLNTIDDNSRKAFGGFALRETDKANIKLEGKTNADGIFEVSYKADNLVKSRASSAAGFIDVKATTSAKKMEIVSDSQQLLIRYPNLVPLPDGNSYDLIGQTPNHPDNHYGTLDVVIALQNIADEYNNQNPGQTLAYNDISLTFGGVFDISGNWQNPHITHGCGTDIDVRPITVQGIQITPADFAAIVNDYFSTAFVIEENAGTTNHHFHIHFVDCFS